MNKGRIVERLCSDLIAKSRDINVLLYFTLLYFDFFRVGDECLWTQRRPLWHSAAYVDDAGCSFIDVDCLGSV